MLRRLANSDDIRVAAMAHGVLGTGHPSASPPRGGPWPASGSLPGRIRSPAQRRNGVRRQSGAVAAPCGRIEQLERCTSALEASGDYRVLRRLRLSPTRRPPEGVPTRRAVSVETETTGLSVLHRPTEQVEKPQTQRLRIPALC
jgi:hypothetical protein